MHGVPHMLLSLTCGTLIPANLFASASVGSGPHSGNKGFWRPYLPFDLWLFVCGVRKPNRPTGFAQAPGLSLLPYLLPMLSPGIRLVREVPALGLTALCPLLPALCQAQDGDPSVSYLVFAWLKN